MQTKIHEQETSTVHQENIAREHLEASCWLQVVLVAGGGRGTGRQCKRNCCSFAVWRRNGLDLHCVKPDGRSFTMSSHLPPSTLAHPCAAPETPWPRSWVTYGLCPALTLTLTTSLKAALALATNRRQCCPSPRLPPNKHSFSLALKEKVDKQVRVANAAGESF